MPDTELTLQLRAFGRIRELLGSGQQEVRMSAGMTIEDLWNRFAASDGELPALRPSTRFFRNGGLAGGATIVEEGDEIGFLPPVGGG